MDEQIIENSEGDEPVKKKKKRKLIKISWKKATLFTVLGLFGLLWYWGSQPIYIVGSQLFGVCRTYIELNVQYPGDLRFIDLRERPPEITVEYMTIDSFGQHIAHRGVCMFKRDENQQIVLDYYRLKRGEKEREWLFRIEDPEKVRRFNLTVPFLLQQPMNLTIRGPARFLGDLTPAQ